MKGKPAGSVADAENWECCMRSKKGKFICKTKVSQEDYYYACESKDDQQGYIAFCKEHWEVDLNGQNNNDGCVIF